MNVRTATILGLPNCNQNELNRILGIITTPPKNYDNIFISVFNSQF